MDNHEEHKESKVANIEFQNLIKNYDGKFQLGPLTYTIAKGATIAILGPNGAGKTTMFQSLTGHLDVSEGEVKIDGTTVKPQNFGLKKKFGYLPQNLDLPPWATAEELLNYNAALHEISDGQPKIEALIKMWDISPYRNRALSACSHGMQKRVGLALALLHEPDVLILDEPFAGLDLYHIRSLESIVAERGRKNQTTILSTHIIPYAARICEKVFILLAGRIQELNGWAPLDWEGRIKLAENQFFAKRD